MYESIIKNKELDKWLFKNDLYCYKNVFYSYGINTLYKLYNLKLDDLKEILPDKNYIIYKKILTKISLIDESKRKSLQDRILNFKDEKASVYSILYNKYAIDNSLSKKIIQYIILLYAIILFSENFILDSFKKFYFYTYSFEYTCIDIYICNFKNIEDNLYLNLYNKIPRIILLSNYLITFIVSYYNYNTNAANIFKIIYGIYFLSVCILNINIQLACYIYNISEITECEKICNPYGKYKIPFYEITILINMLFISYYQKFGYRILFTNSLIKSIVSIRYNLDYLYKINNNKKYDIHVNIIKTDLNKLYGSISLNIFLLLLSEFLYLYANINAYLIIYKDWMKYNQIYKIIKKREETELSNLKNYINNDLNINKKIISQKINNLDELYYIAFMINIKYQKLIYNITKQSYGILIPCAIKNPKRSIQKICRTYYRDTTKLFDVIRSSVVFCNNYKCEGNCKICNSLFENNNESYQLSDIKNRATSFVNFTEYSSRQFYNFNEDIVTDSFKNNESINLIIDYLSIINNKTLSDKSDNYVYNSNNNLSNNFLNFIKKLECNNYIEIIKIKNRFDPKYNSSESIGYRDILINIKIEYNVIDNDINFIERDYWSTKNNYIICEIQLHYNEMYKYKIYTGHVNYKKYRNILSI